ncbi:MAG: carboxylating nicotinate-nucleotide diphosphorylase [Candidatus Altiarchaeota archaeon]|nr:carboxylating nicotinate-nucleotide diphosphorylase [Candidatus Altiarchaeota archaeon]
MNRKNIVSKLDYFLGEDIGSGDVTSSFTPDKKVIACIKSNSQGVIAGVDEVSRIFRGEKIKCRFHVKDGDRVSKGQVIASVEGRARDILPVERTVLNILSRMSGVATLTRKYVDVVSKVNKRTRIAATRKTVPGFRFFDKKAVVVGGGVTHRMGLYDLILIKDNHLMVFGGDISSAISLAKRKYPKIKLEVEVDTVDGAVVAAKAGADMVLLDNMTPSNVKKTIGELTMHGLRRRVLVEASGGINLSNVRKYAKVGVDWISLGELTRAAVGLDYGMDFMKVL